nr:PAS domain-containing protein [Brevundimonas sp. PAMC22021]
MGSLLRAHDWSGSPLGRPETWPQALRSALSTCLNSKAVTAIYWGPQFRLLYNDAYRPFLDARHPWALGRTMAEIWPTMWQALTASAQQVLDTGEGVVAENERLMMERGSGLVESFWYYSFAPIRGETGQVEGIFLTALDTTDRTAAEHRLSDERELLMSLVETTDVMIMAASLDYAILALNKANADEFERIYGVRPKVGDNMLELLANQPEHQAQVRAGWGRGLAGEEVTFIEDYGDLGRTRPYYEVKFRPLRNASGDLTGTYQFVTDVTQRLREQAQLAEAQEALRQSQKMEAMGSLTGGVAHDFNNLLTPIIGSLDMLVRREVGSERERRLIDGALQSAERAKTLVQRLLAFARRQPLQPTAVDVAALIDGMAGLIGSTLGPSIQIRLDVGADLPPAKADRNQLEMALLNLAVNARDAMPEGGVLTVSARCETIRRGHRTNLPPGRYVRVSVIDTGAGMDEATLQRAIEPFFSTKGIGKGTGLGLSMVHGLAAQLGGGMLIESAPGDGARVELFLPISDAVVLHNEEPAATAPVDRVARGTALLVDDEDLVRMSTADMLIDLGFEVVEAASAEQALHLMSTGMAPDVLITDHLMPGMNGTDLAQEARRLRPALRVLIISGYAEAEGLAADLPRLTKPFRNSELATSLLSLVATS